jgi:uncharacterized membrane protein YtjA (UPF0391 family)
MIWLIAALLISLWLLGMISAITLAGFIHTLLVVGLILLLFSLVAGRPRSAR